MKAALIVATSALPAVPVQGTERGDGGKGEDRQRRREVTCSPMDAKGIR
jgi:hypothetical protein